MPYAPNEMMKKAAQTALNYNDEVAPSRRWGTATGLRRARKIAAGQKFDEQEITEILAFLKRFEGEFERQRAAKKYGKAYYAVMGWGGPSGIAWAEDKLRLYQRKREGSRY
jgi:hypothetical protein